MAQRNDDPLWFKQQPKRQARIRKPVGAEFAEAWKLLGDHNASRRMVIVWRVPKDNPKRHMVPDGLMRIPFLKFADETIEDDDQVILPILHGLMRDAAAQMYDGDGSRYVIAESAQMGDNNGAVITGS